VVAAAVVAGTAVAGTVGSAISSSNSASAAKSAADTQAAAADQASNNALAQYQQTQSTLAPFTNTGVNAAGYLNNNLGDYAQNATASTYINNAATDAGNQTNALTEEQNSLAPQLGALSNQGNALGSAGNVAQVGTNLLTGDPAQQEAALQNLPGYQFTLNQGLESTQNAAAARGLGVSGAALKGAASYATGLADNTYNSQLQNTIGQTNALTGVASGYGNNATGYGLEGSAAGNLASGYGSNAQSQLAVNTGAQGNLMNSYNQLLGTAQLGENAGAAVGSQGVAATGNANNYLTGAANAQAAGTVGVANAQNAGISGVTSGLGNAYTQYQQYQLLNQLYGNSGASGGGFINAVSS